MLVEKTAKLALIYKSNFPLHPFHCIRANAPEC
jgi:hypothetical protein